MSPSGQLQTAWPSSQCCALVVVYSSDRKTRHLVAVLPDQLVHGAERPRSPHRRRHPAPGASPGRRGGHRGVLRAGLPLVPGQDLSRGPDRRRGQRLGRCDRAGARRGAHRRGRDRPEAPGDRPRAPSQPALLRSARHAVRQRWPRLPAQQRQEVRPDHLRPARLADAGQPAVEHPARVVPVHRRGVPQRPRPPQRRRDLRPLQLLPRRVAGEQAGHDARGRVRSRAAGQRVRRAQGRAGRRSAGRVAARRRAARASG